MITLENIRFTEAVKQHAGGSTFLGYLYAELCIEGVFSDGSAFEIGMPNLQVRLTADGKPRIDFPSDKKTIRGQEKWVAQYFTAGASSRELMTALVFQLDEVKDALVAAEVLRAAA